MWSIEQVIPVGSSVDLVMLHQNPTRPDGPGIRMNWMLLGVLVSGAAALLVFAVIFAVLGEWLATAGVLAGLCLCLLGAREVDRRLLAGCDDANEDSEDSDRAELDASLVS